MKTKIFFAAGGTGGHIFPAITLVNFFKDKNCDVFLGTDERGERYFKDKSEINLYKINLKTITRIPLIRNLFFYFNIIIASLKCLFVIKKIKPHLIIGFGGYVAFPYCIVSKVLNIPLVIYEPNLVLGRANKVLFPLSSKLLIATNKTKKLPLSNLHKIIEVGALVRKTKKELNQITKNNNFTLLVMGGSQGANIFFEVIPHFVEMMSKRNYKIKIIQQCFLDQIKKLNKFYNNINIENYIFNFEHDIDKFIFQSDLVITRCGASTTAELINFKKPFIGIPYPYAKDNHQFYNAKFYEEKGCCWLLEQKDFSVENLCKLVTYILQDKNKINEIKNNMGKFDFNSTPEKIYTEIKDIINENKLS